MGIFGKNKVLSDVEKLNILTRFSLETTCDKIMEEIPQQGSFMLVVHFFDITGTQNSAQIVVVHHVNSLVQELRDYLKRKDTATEWAGYIKVLSDSAECQSPSVCCCVSGC